MGALFLCVKGAVSRMVQLYQGDCLELMKDIPDGSVDMVLCDLPYGMTACKWDTPLPLGQLWEQYRRIVKSNGAVVLFGVEPFASNLRMSNPEWYKYDWVWNKRAASDFLHAKNKPLNAHEVISVFSPGSVNHASLSASRRMTYNPQGIVSLGMVTRGNRKMSAVSAAHGGLWNSNRTYEAYTNYPKSVLEFTSHAEKRFHPTQKPVPLLEYLIRTYTNPGETVLDNTMGSGSTGVAAVNTGRDFIGMELDPGYFEVAQRRIADAEAVVANG